MKQVLSNPPGVGNQPSRQKDSATQLERRARSRTGPLTIWLEDRNTVGMAQSALRLRPKDLQELRSSSQHRNFFSIRRAYHRFVVQLD